MCKSFVLIFASSSTLWSGTCEHFLNVLALHFALTPGPHPAETSTTYIKGRNYCHFTGPGRLGYVERFTVSCVFVYGLCIYPDVSLALISPIHDWSPSSTKLSSDEEAGGFCTPLWIAWSWPCLGRGEGQRKTAEVTAVPVPLITWTMGKRGSSKTPSTKPIRGVNLEFSLLLLSYIEFCLPLMERLMVSYCLLWLWSGWELVLILQTQYWEG